MSYVLSGIAIVICAGVGATSAWIIVSSIGWDGVGGAIATTIVGMVLATLLFAIGVVLGKALGLLKQTQRVMASTTELADALIACQDRACTLAPITGGDP